MYFIGFGVILAMYIPSMILAYHYDDEFLVKTFNKIYWMLIGTWSVILGAFLAKSDIDRYFYIILGLVWIWVGFISLFVNHCRERKK